MYIQILIPRIAAGQRCMAVSVALLVGEAQSWLPELIERAKKLKVNGGFEPGTDLSVYPFVNTLRLRVK